MTSSEIKRFADQGRIALEQARKFRRAADANDLDELDKQRLLIAARVIEKNSSDWLKVVRELAQ